ncbi:hypothetical protein [Alteromonas genovensis]|uniref:hypothetical protein n=1 Tax=Alteromonas genovensis TaxID=471225 RepID=UPI002FDF6602
MKSEEHLFKKKNIFSRFKLLSFWNKLSVIGTACSIISLFLFFLPQPSGDVVIEKEQQVYSPEEIIKSAKLDSIEQIQPSNNRLLARSVNGFYFSQNVENNVLFSGITPFRLKRVDATFGADYRIMGVANNFDSVRETAEVNILSVSMTDNYGNHYVIEADAGESIGYAESLNYTSQKVVKLDKTEQGYLFDHSNDVQIVLNYNDDNIKVYKK